MRRLCPTDRGAAGAAGGPAGLGAWLLAGGPAARDLSVALDVGLRLQRLAAWLDLLANRGADFAADVKFLTDCVAKWWGSIPEARAFFLIHEIDTYAQQRKAHCSREVGLLGSNESQHTEHKVEILIAGDAAHLRTWSWAVEIWRRYASIHGFSLHVDSGHQAPQVALAGCDGLSEVGNDSSAEMSRAAFGAVLGTAAAAASPTLAAFRGGLHAVSALWMKWLVARQYLSAEAASPDARSSWFVLVEPDMLLSPRCLQWSLQTVLAGYRRDVVIRRPWKLGLNSGFVALRRPGGLRFVEAVLAKSAWPALPLGDDDAFMESLLELDGRYGSECLALLWPSQPEAYSLERYRNCWAAHFTGGADLIDPAKVDLNFVFGANLPIGFPFISHPGGASREEKHKLVDAWRRWNESAQECTLGSHPPFCPPEFAICG
mmetsp:Transcript_2339/g.9171  ORF Transcript_2339/g.9171 Transcript_2339/m.9171 type:complete len:432 (+) Transcript_2339:236-1531(+)